MDDDKSRVRCCVGCGRDTTAANGICLDCVGLGNRRSPHERKPRDDSRSPDDDEEYVRRKGDR